ncbi:MAG: serine hydrolase [Maricaulaceae bacterium]|jgi:CubicO group peptidase (beta-lactamase class C family)
MANARLPNSTQAHPTRRAFAIGSGVAAALAGSAIAARPARASGLDAELIAGALEAGEAMDQMRALVIARDGVELEAHRFRGPSLDAPVNIKSASKTVMAALAGVAIDRGVLESVEQTISPAFADLISENADARVHDITVEDLITMRTGLERTSGRNYGAWVVSNNWTENALNRPFVDEPGGRMLYSTGSYHILSALLTRASGRSTLALARDWLGGPLDIEIPPWTRDPQGVYLGGNEMAMSPRALVKLGELYRLGGVYGGDRVLPETWIQASWTARTRSPFSRDQYGYGWFIDRAGGRRVYYARGYGGQMVYVVPDLELTVAMTSDPNAPGRGGHVEKLNRLLANAIIPAAERGA